MDLCRGPVSPVACDRGYVLYSPQSSQRTQRKRSIEVTMKVEYVFTILTIINALFVTFVIFMQYKLSKDKFKLDLFDKRYAIYEGTKKFLDKI